MADINIFLYLYVCSKLTSLGAKQKFTEVGKKKVALCWGRRLQMTT